MLLTSPEAKTPVSNPTIVLGMHSSGTTLLSRTLSKLGVLMGEDRLASTEESRFFLDLNEKLLLKTEATWYQPDSFLRQIDQLEQSNLAVESLRAACLSRRSKQFLGHRRWRKYGSIFDQPCHWGWKEPRNCLTLPLWLKVFPEARIIFIVRNGVDVSESLVGRERRIRNRSRFGRARYYLRSMMTRHPSTNSLSGFSHPEGFGLWKQYCEAALGAIGKLDCHQLLTLRFEDLVRSPESHLRTLAEFVGLDPDPTSITSAASRIKPGRGWAFVSSPALLDFYRGKKNEPLMKRFAYDRLPPKSSLHSDHKPG